MHPNHVSCTLHCTGLVGAAYRLREDWSKLVNTAINSVNAAGFSEFQEVVFAVLALFQFEYVKRDLYLASLRND